MIPNYTFTFHVIDAGWFSIAGPLTPVTKEALIKPSVRWHLGEYATEHPLCLTLDDFVISTWNGCTPYGRMGPMIGHLGI